MVFKVGNATDNIQRREVVEWNDQLVREITSVSNSISRAVDFWVDNILQGYITEFVVDYNLIYRG